VKDLAVPDLVSANEKELRIFGPKVTGLKTTVRSVVAGGKDFGLTISGANFREGAQVDLRVNGEVYTTVNVQRIGTGAIKLEVPANVVQESGSLAVIVRNPDGSESEARELDVR